MDSNRSTNDTKQNLRNILFGYYIQYNKLKELVDTAFADKRTPKCMDIYIDVFDMLKQIYGREVYADKQYTIVSGVINLAAHMRGFFRTRYNLPTRIFLVYGKNSTVNHKNFYYTFGDDSYKETVNYEKNKEIIESQLQMVKILCAYIPDVYYVERQTMFSMFVYDNILKNKLARNNILSIVITKSLYAYQIPALTNNFSSCVALFRPKKYNGQDMSFPVYGSNVLYNYYSSITSAKTLEYLSDFDPGLLPVLMTMTGLKQYNVNAIMSTTSAVKALHDALSSPYMLNAHSMNTSNLYKALNLMCIDETNFDFRFKAIDLEYQHMIYIHMPEYIDNTWNVNFNDPETVKEINNKYFFDNPLDLNSL